MLLAVSCGAGREGARDLEHPARGTEGAPVVLIEYADFQCPFCGKFAREIEPGLERYVEDGTLRIEWRDFPVLGQESVNAALAARAAQDQGYFWDYHDLLYENQRTKNSGAFSDDKLLDLAREAGLDVERFEAGLKGGAYEAVVKEDFREAVSAGIQGTPSFIINGRMLEGLQPLEALEQVIEEEAQKAEEHQAKGG